ncbi:Histone acetyltransferase GCN5 [Cytospora mali]|uniref:histone acetyltransferase n=1 Tax=Cytospora mali TaxID=578113 RepID=A0A194UZM8_CYTMA|nr:Histone acetyltransferase GCN5 [Valsa mali var. pyri (nom. inval.)]
MSAGPGAGGGAWGGGGSQGYNGCGLPPLEDWKHLPVAEQLQRVIEWRDQQARLIQQSSTPPYAPQSQSQVYAPQGTQSVYPYPQVAQSGPVAPPGVASRRIEAGRPPTVNHPTNHEATTHRETTHPTTLDPTDKRSERESSFDQDYQRWESEVIHGRPSIPTGYVLVPRTPAPGQPIGPLYVSAPPATSAFENPQSVLSVGAQAHESPIIQSQPVAFQASSAASTTLPAIQNLSISDHIAASGPTAAIESFPVNPQPAATAAAEPHLELGISDVQDITFPHLEDLEFQPLTAPVKRPAPYSISESPTSSTEDTEAVRSKTAKNRAKKAKQKEREKAKKAAAAAAAATATSNETCAPAPVNESPASPEEVLSPEEVAAPRTKNQAKKARKKAKRAAAAATEAEEIEFLNKMKEDNAKRKAAEDPSSPAAAKRVKHDDSAEPEPKPKTPVIPFPEKPAVLEERAGDIQFRVVNNDGDKDSFIILTGLKCIFQKQLPKMPKDYIARLVYDRTHLSIAIVKKPLEVVGGITYRPFNERKFAEIVFCAISSDQQVKGYGAHLMAHLKDYVKSTSPIMHFLTYADNYAIGYFKKQGFTKEITLDKSVWMGYIKDYEGGTIMQCTMLERVRYLEVPRMLQKQKECVLAKIRAFSKSHIIHQPPKQWKNGVSAIDPQKIEAIKNSGWSPEMDELARQPRHGPNYSQLLHLLNDMQNHQSAWPFLMPVNKDDVHDYYDVIKEPMDLSTMEQKLEMDQYTTPEDFIKDATLIFKNCRQYNSEGTPYTKSANKLEKYMWSKIKEIPEWSHLAENQGK